MIKTCGLILAGGLSTRMGGGDKTLLPLNGRTMLEHIIERFEHQVETLAINANGDEARFAKFALPVVRDSIDGYAGPLAGILAGIQWAKTLPNHPTHLVTVAGDTPIFPRDLVAQFMSANDDATARIVLARAQGSHQPIFGMWPLCLGDDLVDWMSKTDFYKVMAWVRTHEHAYADFDSPERGDPFFNANTPQDFKHLETLIKTGALI